MGPTINRDSRDKPLRRLSVRTRLVLLLLFSLTIVGSYVLVDRATRPTRALPRGTRLFFVVEDPRSGRQDLWLFTMGSRSPRRLLVDINECAISSDGSKVAFSKGKNPPRILQILSIKTGQAQTFWIGDAQIREWSPDGSYLLCNQFRGSGGIERPMIYSCRSRKFVFAPFSGEHLTFGWTPDNHILLTWRKWGEDPRGAYLLDKRARVLRYLPSFREVARLNLGGWALSPDCRRLYFQSMGVPYSRSILVASLQDYEVKKIEYGDMPFDQSFSLNPTSSVIGGDNSANEVLVWDPKGTTIRISDEGLDVYDQFGDWSPDGRWLVFVHNRRNLYAVRGDGTGLRKIWTLRVSVASVTRWLKANGTEWLKAHVSTGRRRGTTSTYILNEFLPEIAYTVAWCPGERKTASLRDNSRKEEPHL